jgi:hypothetical protein
MPKLPFLDEHRWDLCKSFLDRADRSADVMRALLFTASSAGVGFSLHQTEPDSKCHLISVALFAVAVAVVFWSWDLQKRKARERFKLIRDEGVAAYIANEKDMPSDRRLDWIAAGAAGLAVIVEGLLAWRLE